MLNILCYGDSNTWGQVPGADTDRFQRQDRWPQVMASHLGDGYEVFEAGLSGRTTTFDRPPRQWRNGRDLLVPTLETYSPLDLVIILLGTNDVSLPYLSVADITAGAGELVEIVRPANSSVPSSRRRQSHSWLPRTRSDPSAPRTQCWLRVRRRSHVRWSTPIERWRPRFTVTSPTCRESSTPARVIPGTGRSRVSTLPARPSPREFPRILKASPS